MKKAAILAVLILTIIPVVWATDIPRYPGAKFKESQSNEKNKIYTTPDDFKKVYDFYGRTGKEIPALPKVLEGPIKLVYFSFENSKWRVQISSNRDGSTRIHEFTGYNER